MDNYCAWSGMQAGRTVSVSVVGCVLSNEAVVSVHSYRYGELRSRRQSHRSRMGRLAGDWISKVVSGRVWQGETLAFSARKI